MDIDKYFNTKRVLVTGATGFIGGRLALRLHNEEKAHVTGTGRNPASGSALEQSGINVKYADLRDMASMRSIIAGNKVIFHCAAWLRKYGDPRLAYEINVNATLDLVRLSAEEGVKRMLLIGSISAYGPPRQAIMDETVPLDPHQRNIYGRTKALGEVRAMELSEKLGLPLTVIRPGIVYGSGSLWWATGVLRLWKEGPAVIFGDGGSVSLTYIDNLIDAILLGAAHPAAGGHAFNLCDESVSIRDLARYYPPLFGRKVHFLPGWTAYPLILMNRVLRLGLNISRDKIRRLKTGSQFLSDKAESLLGYKARVSLEEGMLETRAWLETSSVKNG